MHCSPAGVNKPWLLLHFSKEHLVCQMPGCMNARYSVRNMKRDYITFLAIVLRETKPAEPPALHGRVVPQNIHPIGFANPFYSLSNMPTPTILMFYFFRSILLRIDNVIRDANTY